MEFEIAFFKSIKNFSFRLGSGQQLFFLIYPAQSRFVPVSFNNLIWSLRL